MKWNLSYIRLHPARAILEYEHKINYDKLMEHILLQLPISLSWVLLALHSMQSLVILQGGQVFLDLIDHNTNISDVRNVCQHSRTSRCRSKCFRVSWCSHQMMFIKGWTRMDRLCWVAWLGIYPFDARRSCSIIKESDLAWLGRMESAFFSVGSQNFKGITADSVFRCHILPLLHPTLPIYSFLACFSQKWAYSAMELLHEIWVAPKFSC